MSSTDQAQDRGLRSLFELEARFKRECELLQMPPAKVWLEPKSHPALGPVLDVAIVGAGMAGLAAALSLKRVGITNVRIFDKTAEGREGPWLAYARMDVLRSPPELAGPALGFANLSFRAWFEAQFGHEDWAALHRIPRTQWMEYLVWYRRMIGTKIENDCEMTSIDGVDSYVVLSLRSATSERKVAARRVILANGRDGLGGAFVPELFRRLPKVVCAHSSDDIDFAALKGKVVGVVGAGASAVDNAAVALEHGAADVAMLVRRPDVPRINRGMGIGSAGMWHGFYDLPPERRVAIVQFVADNAIPPPRDSMLRCSRHPNFAVVTGCVPTAVRTEGDRVVLETSRGTLAFDRLILATGFNVDWQKRPELANLSRHIELWRDRYRSPDGRLFEQAEDPWLGPALQFTARDSGVASWVERVHCYSFPAFLSHGPLTGDIPAINVGADRIAEGIASALFGEDFERNWEKLLAFDTPELRGDEFIAAEDISAFLHKECISPQGMSSMSEQTHDDVMTRLASVEPGSAVAAARALRPDVIRFTETADAAIFRPSNEAGFTRAERAAAGLRIARLTGERTLIAHYEALLRPIDGDGELSASVEGVTPQGAGRWSRILAHIDRLTTEPGASAPLHLAVLGEAGLSPQAIIALSQLIAYVSYQTRLLAGLRATGFGKAPSPIGAAAMPAAKPMRDFTRGELEWQPWITPVDLDAATAEQREALRITPSNRAVGAYALVLAHDPQTVKERSPLYNAIMFGPKGLPRADRELGAVVASRINGCAYCAAVHAKRFTELSKEPTVMERLYRDGLVADLDPRRAAIVGYAAKLTSAPAALDSDDATPLRVAGLSDGEILDLTNAVAMFAWANRLMQSLGASK